MQTHDLIQGTPEWHAYRAEHDNASDAPAMMGASSYKSRDQLVAEHATGIVPEVDAAMQRRFDDGHRFEALARPLAEKIIGEDLGPVTGSEGRLSASFDGLTMLDDVAFEHKSLNARLRAVLSVPGCTGADLPIEYQIQMEQQAAVSLCEKVLFMASSWRLNQDTGEWELVESLHCWYTPNLELRAKIVAGWEQFHKDVAAFVPAASAAPVVAEAVTALPTVFAQVTGSIAIKDNLPAFEVALRDFIEHRLIRTPETDQDFADLDLQIKALKGAEAALDAVEEQTFSQVETVAALKRTKDMLHKMTRDNRLAAEKLLATRKEQIKLERVQEGQTKLAQHIAALNARLGKPYMPAIAADFAGCVKGKRNIDSLRDAVNTELARAKIAANEVADRIQVNLTTLRELASQHAFLFADTPTIVLKATDDCAVLVKARIAEHLAAEAARLEAERERIRAEEQAKAQREAEAKARAEAAEFARQQDEALAQQRREDQARQLAEANAVAAANVVIAQAAAAQEPESNQAPALTRCALEAIEKVASPDAGMDAIRDALTHGTGVVFMHSCGSVSVVPVKDAFDDGARINLGAINEHLAPIKLDAAGLESLGFTPVAVVKASKQFRACDLPAIRAALMAHLERLQELQTA